MTAPLLSVRDVGVAYGSTPVLSGVSLSVPGGGVSVVVGATHTGKTTLLRAISGLLAFHGGRVTAGAIEVAGRSVRGHSAASLTRLGVAHVLQGRRVFADLTVEENLRVGGFTEKAAGREGVERVLARFPLLAQRRSTAAGYLSGGEQQLLAIARALVASPRVLLLDEPTLGLSSQAVDLVAQVIGEVAAQGAAVVVAEDRGGLARSTGASTIVLDRGRAAVTT